MKVKLERFHTVLYEIGGAERHFMTAIMSRLDCTYENENTSSVVRGPKVHINFFEPKHIGHLQPTVWKNEKFTHLKSIS